MNFKFLVGQTVEFTRAAAKLGCLRCSGRCRKSIRRWIENTAFKANKGPSGARSNTTSLRRIRAQVNMR